METRPSAAVSSDLTRQAASPAPPELPVVRFGLRQLFALVTTIGFISAVLAAAPNGVVSAAILVALLVVAAHVGSTALGSRLRAHADRHQAWQRAQDQSPAATPALPTHRRSAANTRPSAMYERHAAVRWLTPWTIAGALLGCVGGAVLLALTVGHRASIPGLAVGTLSLSMLGGWFAFLAGSFGGILHRSWREAVLEQEEDRLRASVARPASL